LQKQYNFDKVNEFCISQRSAVTFSWCGGQMHSQLCQISSGFHIPKIIKIWSFLAGVIQYIIGSRIFGPQFMPVCVCVYIRVYK